MEKPEYSAGAKLYATHSSRADADNVDKHVEEWMHRMLPRTLKDMVVADAGAGAGRWIPVFQERKARSIIAIDQSKMMLDQIVDAPSVIDAKDFSPHDKNDLILVHGDVKEVLQNARAAINLVFANFSLCTIEEPQPVIDAMYNSLVVGGIAMVSTNVIITNEAAPFLEKPIQPADLSRTSPIPTRHIDSMRKEVRIILHFPAGDLPIVDCMHEEKDYAVDTSLWEVTESDLVLPSGVTVLNGDDREVNSKYYGSISPRALSLKEGDAQLAHLCLKLVKK